MVEEILGGQVIKKAECRGRLTLDGLSGCGLGANMRELGSG